jgi:hypothetical protein
VLELLQPFLEGRQFDATGAQESGESLSSVTLSARGGRAKKGGQYQEHDGKCHAGEDMVAEETYQGGKCGSNYKTSNG